MGKDMKILVVVLIVAAIAGGLIGGELSDRPFTIWGAALGAGATFAVIFGLGGFFAWRDKQKRRADDLPPEIRAVFEHMVDRNAAGSRSPTPPRSPARPKIPSIESTIANLVEQDRQEIAAGRVPEKRLIPQHAIKRDIILRAYEIDFQSLTPETRAANLLDFESKINGIKRLNVDELDSVIALMRRTRFDLSEIEHKVRADHPWYSKIERLFPDE
jgi:hypothetical protein